MTRVHEHKRLWVLTQSRFEEAIRMLVLEIKRNDVSIDTVIGIARGGVPPASLIAKELCVPLFIVMASHNFSEKVFSAPRAVVQIDFAGIANIAHVKHLLVIDDIAGTGGTLRNVVSGIVQIIPSCKISTLTLCSNTGTSFTPTYHIWDVRDWVIFPWEAIPAGMCIERLPQPNVVSICL